MTFAAPADPGNWLLSTPFVIEIPSSVKTIGAYAFYKRTGLVNISIPASVTAIGAYAFDNTGIKTMQIPESVTSIADYCFNGCSSLSEIVIPNTVVSIGEYAFRDCTNLNFIVYPFSYAFDYVSLNDLNYSLMELNELRLPNNLKIIE